MLRCSRVTGVVVGVLFLALAYHLYIPVPEGMAHPILFRFVAGSFKVINLVGAVTEKLGLCSTLNLTRAITDNLARSTSLDDPDLEVTDTRFEGVPVRIYRSKSAPKLSPALVYMHGGGWVFGSIHLLDSTVADLTKKAGMVVVSVEYRLAPEHPFPVPFEDCVRATIHLLHNGHKYGVDPKRVAVGGDSAGGNLAAAVALRLSEESEDFLPRLKLQVLIYPCLQALTFNLPSYLQYDKMLPTRESMPSYWLKYMGLEHSMHLVPSLLADNHTSPLLKKSEYGKSVSTNALPLKFRPKTGAGDGVKGSDYGDVELSAQLEPTLTNPYFAPLMASSVKSVAPALIYVAEVDVLRDDGLLYFEKLRSAGVMAYLEHDPVAFHSCFFSGYEIGRKWAQKIAEYLKKYV